jgi:hypothetical protein
MKKTVCSLLVLSILSMTVPAWAADDGSTKTASPETVTPLRSAIAKAGTQLSQIPATPAAAKAQIPRTPKRTGSDRTRMRRGAGMMVFGLISTLVGVGATVYMVREMKKDTDDALSTIPK